MEVGTGRALSAVILVTWTATPGETARERGAVVRIPVRADVNEPRSCYIPVCHRRDPRRFSFIYVPPSNILARATQREKEREREWPASDFYSARVQILLASFLALPAPCCELVAAQIFRRPRSSARPFAEEQTPSSPSSSSSPFAKGGHGGIVANRFKRFRGGWKNIGRG